MRTVSGSDYAMPLPMNKQYTDEDQESNCSDYPMLNSGRAWYHPQVHGQAGLPPRIAVPALPLEQKRVGGGPRRPGGSGPQGGSADEGAFGDLSSAWSGFLSFFGGESDAEPAKASRPPAWHCVPKTGPNSGAVARDPYAQHELHLPPHLHQYPAAVPMATMQPAMQPGQPGSRPLQTKLPVRRDKRECRSCDGLGQICEDPEEEQAAAGKYAAMDGAVHVSGDAGMTRKLQWA